MLLQAIAEYGVTNSGVGLGARVNQAASWLETEVSRVSDAASRNPGMTLIVVALILVFFIARALATR